MHSLVNPLYVGSFYVGSYWRFSERWSRCVLSAV
jgi:hypothetical protein